MSVSVSSYSCSYKKVSGWTSKKDDITYTRAEKFRFHNVPYGTDMFWLNYTFFLWSPRLRSWQLRWWVVHVTHILVPAIHSQHLCSTRTRRILQRTHITTIGSNLTKNLTKGLIKLFLLFGQVGVLLFFFLKQGFEITCRFVNERYFCKQRKVQRNRSPLSVCKTLI